jgi:uncharacterized protein YndB with AHSA1/START domain
MNTAKMTLPHDEQILITREFDAPRHMVYQAWTTPELVTQWWAGKRGTVTSVEIDLRVGGGWRYVMVANGGFEVAFHGEYREIVPDSRLVSTEVFEGMPDAATVSTATFTELAGRTTVSLLIAAPSKFARDMIVESGMEGGMRESWDLLEQVATSLS